MNAPPRTAFVTDKVWRWPLAPDGWELVSPRMFAVVREGDVVETLFDYWIVTSVNEDWLRMDKVSNTLAVSTPVSRDEFNTMLAVGVLVWRKIRYT